MHGSKQLNSVWINLPELLEVLKPKVRSFTFWSVPFSNGVSFVCDWGVKLIFTEGHINIMFALKGPVVKSQSSTLMLNQCLSDVIMVVLQWKEP